MEKRYKIFFILNLIFEGYSAIVGVHRRDESSAIPRNLELELVQALFRHGERTVIQIEHDIYPYLNASVYEPYGIGQLTNKGKEQMYNVGRALRERYSNYLNVKYINDEVYAYTSADDRTKISLQLVLAGIYPPSPGLVWNPNLEWIPLPFRYTPKEVDVLMKSHESKKFESLVNKSRQRQEYLRSVARFSHVFELFNNITDWPISYSNPDVVISMFNMLNIHERMSLPIPNWYTESMKRDLAACYALVMRTRSITRKQKRLDGGTMIRTTLENMNLNNELTNPRRIYLYSGHDMTLNGFLGALDQHRVIDFGATLMLEKLRERENRGLFVRLLSYSPIDKKTIALRLGDCEEFCPINDYLKFIANVVPTDEERDVLLNEFNVDRLKELFFADENVKTATPRLL